MLFFVVQIPAFLKFSVIVRVRKEGVAMNFTRKDKYTIKEEVFRLISQQENTDKDQDLQFLEAELAKLFIANQNETTEPDEELL